MNEIPNITSSTYTTSHINPALIVGGAIGGNAMLANQHGLAQWAADQQFKQAQEAKPMSARIVKVYIADPNDNLPLEKRLLYTGDEKLTDLTDQELFFEVPIKELIDTHNALRAKTVDKKQSEKFGRDIFLDPARIRDLKMVVVAVAAF